MAPKVATVVKTFMLTVDIEAEPRPAVDWLTDMCVAHEWMSSREEALEWAERSQAKFLNDLRRESSLLAALGRFASNSSGLSCLNVSV